MLGIKTAAVRITSLGCIAVIYFTSVSLKGVDSIYMQIPTIPGESTADGHEAWIDLLSVSANISNPSHGYLSLPPVPGDIVATKFIDKASPKLGEALTGGGLLTDVVVEITRAPAGLAESTYFECRLREAFIINQLLKSAGADPTPTESVSLNYSRMDWVYRVLSPDGVALEQSGAYWDFVDNSGGASDGVPGNQPPTSDIIGNQSVDPGTTTAIDFLVSDTESDPADLVVTATTSRPDLISDLLVTGSGRERQISFRSSGVLSGAAAISLVISDGTSSRTMSFPVLIDVEMTPYEGYLTAYFNEDERTDPALASPIQDPDKDGLLTLIEYLLGTNPREFNQAGEAISVAHREEAGVRKIDLQFRRRTDDPLIQGALWGSSDMKNWTRLETSNPLYEETNTQGENPLFEDVSASITLPTGTDPYFVRLQVLDAF
jgi:type VI secretion system Hcp family effector